MSRAARCSARGRRRSTAASPRRGGRRRRRATIWSSCERYHPAIAPSKGRRDRGCRGARDPAIARPAHEPPAPHGGPDRAARPLGGHAQGCAERPAADPAGGPRTDPPVYWLGHGHGFPLPFRRFQRPRGQADPAPRRCRERARTGDRARVRRGDPRARRRDPRRARRAPGGLRPDAGRAGAARPGAPPRHGEGAPEEGERAAPGGDGRRPPRGLRVRPGGDEADARDAPLRRPARSAASSSTRARSPR